MKKGIKTILAILVVITTLSFAFQKEDDRIYYDKNRPLVWEDFKGKPDFGVGDAALTFTRMKNNFSWSNDSATINLQSYFDKTKSWVKKDKKTDYLLKHEQGHFDISQIYFCKLVKEIQETKFYAKTFGDEVNKMIAANSNELNKEQALYDKESNHSIIEPKQKEWNDKIARELKEFEPYQSTKIVVKLW
jgi:hypothetical protein